VGSTVTGSGAAPRYTSLSRFTDPANRRALLDSLPSEPLAICEVASDQTIHHNLLGYYRISVAQQRQMARVRPPRLADLLTALSEREPHTLTRGRRPEQRIIGACVLESHLLAGMLRYRNIPARVRAGYFKGVMDDPATTLPFWREALSAKEASAEARREDPSKWALELDEFTRRQIALDHRIEHWVCEYWAGAESGWRLLDANTAFLRAHSGIEVPPQLPRRYFEYPFEAWRKSRSDPRFDPDQYAEDPQDGRSHIRSQMLSDFFSLLNHDVAGVYEPDAESTRFIKERRFSDLAASELGELDRMADLLSSDPTVDQLVTFYRAPSTVRLDAAEKDPYSFLHRPEEG
jgi:hypothetical protein